jgi:hypothetical protein
MHDRFGEKMNAEKLKTKRESNGIGSIRPRGRVCFQAFICDGFFSGKAQGQVQIGGQAAFDFYQFIIS